MTVVAELKEGGTSDESAIPSQAAPSPIGLLCNRLY
jgi:hypothetical protein